jgi:hypothetical protein
MDDAAHNIAAFHTAMAGDNGQRNWALLIQPLMGPGVLSLLPLSPVFAPAHHRATPLSLAHTHDGRWLDPSALARQRVAPEAATCCLTSEMTCPDS